MTEFRPCIDLHAGKVKQIVGSTLSLDESVKRTQTDSSSLDLVTNFETEASSATFATRYKRDELFNGHVIMLGSDEANREAAIKALQAFPNGLQIGGGMNPENCKQYLEAGASHIIVTSYLFSKGEVDMQKLSAISTAVGKGKLVLDLSCRKKVDAAGDGAATGNYFVVTDKWQTFTTLEVKKETLELLANYCSQFLVHGVDVEGKRCGVLEDLIELLAENSPIEVT